MPIDSGITVSTLGGALSADEQYIRNALDLAREAGKRNEVPIGAVIVHDGAILAAASNRTIRDQDPTAHAEVLAIREAASKLDRWRLDDCTLYVTKEPCPMCSGAMLMSRVQRVCYAVPDPKMGCLGGATNLNDLPRVNHRVELTVGAVLEAECRDLLQAFFRLKRKESDA